VTRLVTVSLMLAASHLLLGCQEKAADPAPAAQPAPPTPQPAAAPAPAPAPSPVAQATPDPAQDLPASEDFEQQALDEINPQNLEQELDKLEKEIGQ
jgi:hypothetical protein